MRFALLEAKLALIHLLRRFTFIQAPDTEVGCCGVHVYNMCRLLCLQVPIETSFGLAVTPKNGVFLRISKRN